MVYTAEQAARNAEDDQANLPGLCLQATRLWLGIGAFWPDAATAWRMNMAKRTDRNPPRGAPVFWLGGSKGYGHIALSLGAGRVRSTDAGGRGVVATRPLGWVEDTWGQTYAGWSTVLNGVEIPGLEDEMTPEDWARLRDIVAEETTKAVEINNDAAAREVWNKEIEVTEPAGDNALKPAKQLLRQLWQRSS
jgi:hypothetical protein